MPAAAISGTALSTQKLARRFARTLIVAIAIGCVARGGRAASGCKDALARLVVCGPANTFALDTMRRRRLEADTVMQDVATGALVVFAASQPATLDVSTQVLPLSLSKLFLAASWWDNKQPDLLQGTQNDESAGSHGSEKSVIVREMLVNSSDSAGAQVALALRRTVGTQKVLVDFRRYGFNRGDEPFWAEADPQWMKRLTPQPAYALIDTLNDGHWSSVLSIGESHMMVTALQVSRFLQAVGNNGILCAPVARSATKSTAHESKPACSTLTRVVEEATARQLRAAMIDTVQRGTASGIATSLSGTGWTIGGKTGTGGRPGQTMSQQDGWFAGLVFDLHAKARYTVATFVRRGGRGGGNAADISAQLARFLLADSAGRADQLAHGEAVGEAAIQQICKRAP
jgi:cell division protein FtsI/penicillin-binding protein 2